MRAKEFKPGIEAVVVSIGEPQERRCLEAINSQVQPFERITHIKNVKPLFKAHNQGLAALEHEYAIFCAGDMTLYRNATVIAVAQIAKHGGEDIFVYKFALFDTFLNCTISCCRMYQSDVAQKFPRRNVLREDVEADERALKAGYKRIQLVKERVVVGTHFDEPDEFQAFRRFFVEGVKRGDHRKGQKLLMRLKELRDATDDDRKKYLYKVAIDGFMQGCGGAYPASHNVDYDLEQYAKAGYGKGQPKCFE